MIEEYRELTEELARSGVNIEMLHDGMIMTEGNEIICLDLSDLKLSCIPAAVNGLEDLQTLDLSNNRITTIENLDNLENLRTLDLTGNMIGEISGIEKLKSLSVLGLANNLVEDISGLDNLHSLCVLNLSRNSIEEIKGLEELEKLKHLDLSKNSIVTVKGLFYPLDALYLRGNPLSLEIMEKMIHSDNHEFITWVNNHSVDIEFGSSDMVGNHYLDADEFLRKVKSGKKIRYP